MIKFWNVAEHEQSAELLLYGEIGDDSEWLTDDLVTPRAFVEDVHALGDKPLTVRINSPGGSVFAALAIRNALVSYPGQVEVIVDGLAASAASLIVCVGRSKMSRSSLLMIHRPSVDLFGLFDATDLERVQKSLAAVKETIINVYMSKVGGRMTESELTWLMDVETWMMAEEALQFGFIDEIIDLPVKVETRAGVTFVNSVGVNAKRFKRADEFYAKVRKPIEMDESNVEMTLRKELIDVKAQLSSMMARVASMEEERRRDVEMYQLVRDQLTSGAEGIKPAPLPIDARRESVAEVVRYANALQGG